MLLLCFSLGYDRFAIDASVVHEVVPQVKLKDIPKTPAWVAGIICYHGKMIPVLDLCALHLSRKATAYLSTRIILVHYTGCDKTEHLLGFLAEQVTEAIHRQRQDFQSTGIDTPDVPYLGGIAHDRAGMLQWIDIDRLLPESVQQLLFRQQQDVEQ